MISYDFPIICYDLPMIAWFPNLADLTMTPRTNIIYLCRDQDTPKNSRKQANIFGNYSVGNFNILKIKHFENLKKDGHRNIMEVRQIVFEIVHTGSISSRKQEMCFARWAPHLPHNIR